MLVGMQLQGWRLARASRIVIILLVVQHLGLGQLLAFAPPTTTDSSPAGPSEASTALDTVVPLAILADASVILAELDGLRERRLRFQIVGE
jgi:hypothetical protein